MALRGPSGNLFPAALRSTISPQMPDHSAPRVKPSPSETYVVGRPNSPLSALAVCIIAVAALYFARDVFVPLALAILLSFALGPLVGLLRRLHFGQAPSVIASVFLAFLVIFAVGSFIGSQLTQLAENLPQYQTNISAKIQSLRGSITAKGIVGRASVMLKDLDSEIKGAPAPKEKQVSPAPIPRNTQGPQPIPVEIRQPEPNALEVIQAIIAPLLQPLATTGLIVVFVIFFLLQREDLRDRFIRLAGTRDLHRTTKGLDDAAHRLSRYLLAQTAINTSFGVLIGTGLWFIGVPNPILWGILGMLLRFVPYIGPIIAAIFPAVLAVAVDPGWSMLLWTGVLFVVVEPIIGQIVEPYLYGHSTGLSAVAVVVAAAFWTWLWGPIGLLLSTPLTLCLVVLGRHVDRLEFLDIILGDRPALTLEENFYQRMLASDPDEAARQAEEFLKTKPLSAYYDDVAIRGLALAQLDVNRGVLEHERRVLIKEAALGVIDNLSDHALTATSGNEKTASPDGPTLPIARPLIDALVLCVAGRGSLDEAAATILAQLLQERGAVTRVISTDDVAAANLYRLDVTDAQLAFLSYLEPGGFTNARYLVRRLRRKLPRVPIVVGLWTLTDEDAEGREALRETGADFVVTSLQQAVEKAAAISAEKPVDAGTSLQLAGAPLPPYSGT
jgi:predicted PurR-regulated permease PerM